MFKSAVLVCTSVANIIKLCRRNLRFIILSEVMT
jgi:hypothetical protein